jgi:hypothetical protein
LALSKQTFTRKLILAVAVLFSIQLNAQKGVNKLVIAADLGIPTGDFSEIAGVGGCIMGKLLFGISPSGDITGTTGISFYGIKDFDLGYGFDDIKGSWSIIPVLAGYRHNFNGGFFLEPQIGMGIYAAKVKYQGESESNSQSAFTWAVGFGYTKKNLEVGVRYQSGENDGSLSLVGLHFGYILPLKNRR